MRTEDNMSIIFEECTNVSNEDDGIAVCGGMVIAEPYVKLCY